MDEGTSAHDLVQRTFLGCLEAPALRRSTVEGLETPAGRIRDAIGA